MNLPEYCSRVMGESFVSLYGRVKKVRRDSVRAYVPTASVGALCEINTSRGIVPVEIVSLDPDGHVAMPLDTLEGVQLGDFMNLREATASIPVGEELLGRVVDSLCQPYDKEVPLRLTERISLYGTGENPMDREIISDPLDLGVRSINACLSCGRGQRQGIFAGSGVGKSVLLGMMARHTNADVVVIGLIGERGREVKEFIERELGERSRKKSVVVVETAEKSPVRRVRGAYVAAAVAEYYRMRGANVLLLMDSLTRFAMAQREIGMAAGEPPTTKGYTPSVFNAISRLAERAGNWGDKGSITGLYTVLVEGDDMDDPIADATRAILDGHIVLSRKLANKGQYPAIDVLASVSRTMDSVVGKEQMILARRLKETLSVYFENEDAINTGLYERGNSLQIDESLEKYPAIIDFLKQDRDYRASFLESRQDLQKLFE